MRAIVFTGLLSNFLWMSEFVHSKGGLLTIAGLALFFPSKSMNKTKQLLPKYFGVK